MKSCKYLPKKLLIEFSRAAKREKRNRYIDENFLSTLPDANYPVKLVFYHTRDEVRTAIVLDEKGNFTLLDMSQERYDLIPTASIDQDGKVFIKSEDEIRKAMPYGGGEWVESKVKKAYRGQQTSFRNEVLTAYQNTCAVCECSQDNLLVAAHIQDKAHGGPDTVQNGLCLCANHHIAFDRGELRIMPDGTVFSFNQDPTITVTRIKFPKRKVDYPSEKFLQWKYAHIKP